MKKFTTLLLATLLIVALCTPAQAQVLWRSAKTLSQGQAIVMASWYLMDYTKSYDWASEEWKDFPDGKESSCWGFETMFGYGVTDRLEVHLHVPILFKSSKNVGADEISASGIGDIYLKGRYALVPWTKNHFGLTFTGNLRFPTGDEEADIALGDGTVDLGLGAIYSSAWMNDFRGHVKLGYWLNGENEDEVNVGNELKLILKLDRNFTPKVMGFLSYTYYSQTKKETAAGIVPNSQKIRHYASLGGVWKPKAGMFVRPKVIIPVGGEGGTLFDFKPMVDFWYVFKI